MPPTTPLEDRYGRSQKKNIALAAWHAPLGGRAQEADLCRRQGFGRIAPSDHLDLKTGMYKGRQVLKAKEF